MNNLYLAHHGILGQKWGVRRFQNPDGTLTAAGKRRIAKTSKYRDKVIEENNIAIENQKRWNSLKEKSIEEANKYGKFSEPYMRNVESRLTQYLKDTGVIEGDEVDDYDYDEVTSFVEKNGYLYTAKLMDDIYGEVTIKDLTDAYRKSIDIGNEYIKEITDANESLKKMEIDINTSKSDIRKSKYNRFSYRG